MYEWFIAENTMLSFSAIGNFYLTTKIVNLNYYRPIVRACISTTIKKKVYEKDVAKK